MDKKSFSLIEVIAAVVILEMITVSMLGLLAMNNRTMLHNEDRLRVNALLQRKVEEIRLLPMDFIHRQDNFIYALEYPQYQFFVSEQCLHGNTFEDCLNNGSEQLKKVTVTLGWVNFDGPQGATPPEEKVTFLKSRPR